MSYRRSLIIVVCFLAIFYLAECATTSKPKAGSSTTPKSTKTATVSTSKVKGKTNSTTKRGPVITLRVGEDGNPNEQCQCVTFHLCDSGNEVTTSANGQSVTCPDTNQVCCAIPVTDIGVIEPGISIPDTPQPQPPVPVVTDPSFNSGSSQAPPNCVCIPFYQCQNYDPEATNGGAGLIDIRISCSASEVCCPVESIVTSSPPVDPNTTDPYLPVSPPEPAPGPEEPDCGIRRSQIDTRIVSPESLKQTSFGEFSWMALVLTVETAPNGTRIDNVFVCGASVISNNAVLTAAHCVADTNINLLKIRVGEWDTHRSATNEPLPHQDRSVSAIHIHPNFNSRTLYNDLAILTASEPFQYAQNVAPICLPLIGSIYTSGSYDPRNCLATGWGKNAFEEGTYQTKLRKVDLSLVNNEACQQQLRGTRLGQFFNLDSSFICAGGQPEFDTCQGDGGGPLVCAVTGVPNKYVQVGIVSWGIGCGTTVPAVYASLEANSNWLTTEINTLFVFRKGK